jgi:DNA-binding CsgD family transcriptional regulator
MNLISNSLSPRELEIYNYLLKGLDYYSIADELGVQKSTIKTHILHLYNKLLVNSRQELMAQRIQELEQMIDNLRGVASGYIVRRLCARGLVKVVGKSELPGKPNLYGTTSEFLDYFGLGQISDLPKMETEEEILDDKTDLFTSIYKED